MEPRLFQLRGATLAELKHRIRREHGEDALIVAADRVTVGGIRGFFARQHYEVTVEVPPRRRAAHALDLPARLGIAALLDDADEQESQLGPRVAALPSVTPVSTESEGFAALMDELTFATARSEAAPVPDDGASRAQSTLLAVANREEAATPPATAQRTVAPVVPRVLSGRGDLVLLIGLTDQALEVARTMIARANGGELRVGGLLAATGIDRVDDRRTAGAARAVGVEREHPVFVAFGLGRSLVEVSHDFALRAASLGTLHADQIWVVADATQKAADTDRWVQLIAAEVPVDGAVGIGREYTSTPESLASLELPVLWHSTAELAAPTTRRAARGMAGHGSR